MYVHTHTCTHMHLYVKLNYCTWPYWWCPSFLGIERPGDGSSCPRHWLVSAHHDCWRLCPGPPSDSQGAAIRYSSQGSDSQRNQGKGGNKKKAVTQKLREQTALTNAKALGMQVVQSWSKANVIMGEKIRISASVGWCNGFQGFSASTSWVFSRGDVDSL